MTEAEIFAKVRRDIGQYGVITVGPTQLSAELSNAVEQFWLAIEEATPRKTQKQKSLTSTTNVFTLPSDHRKTVQLWDLGESAVVVTDATVATPINIEATAHGRSDDDILVVHDVGGNLVANGTHKITYVDVDNFTLDGTVGTDAYTSGGYVYPIKRYMYPMTELNQGRLTYSNRYGYLLEDDKIVVDYLNFTNSLVIDYHREPEGLTDIPSQYHVGVAGFITVQLGEVPDTKDPGYANIAKNLKRAQNDLSIALGDISKSKMSTQPQRFPEGINWEAMAC